MKLKKLSSLLILATSCSVLWAADTAQKVAVTLTDAAIKIDKSKIKPGKVVFEVTNKSTTKLDHEMVVLLTDLDSAKLPVKDGKVEESKVTNVGEIEGVKPGGKKQLELTLKEGHYSLICNVPGHYAMGMNTPLVVEK